MYLMASSSSSSPISITRKIPLSPPSPWSSFPLSNACGGAQFKSRKLHYYNLGALGGNQSQLSYPLKLNRFKPRQSFSLRAEYSDGPKSGGSDFVAGFLLGGAIFGTLAYVFAPKIRKSIMNEDEYGFQRAKRPIYYDEGLEKTRRTLNEKISQLNSAIDNVSLRLRGGTGSMAAAEDVEADSEVEASMW